MRARNAGGASEYSNVQCAATPANSTNYALDFGSGNACLTFGSATSTLGLDGFTLETWFKRSGPGTTSDTGNGA